VLKKISISCFAALLLIGLSSLEFPVADRAGVQLSPAPPRDNPVVWPEQPGFRVDNFNVQRGKGLDDVRDLNRAIDVLKGSELAGLQELSGTFFYGWHDQIHQVAVATGLDYLFAPTTYRWLQPNKGSGLLSRFPVNSWSIECLPEVAETEANPRNLIRAEMTILGRPVTVLVTHLDRRENNAVQLDYVLNAFREVEGPVILLGDLNTDNRNEVLMNFIAEPGVVDAVEESIGPFWRLDWIITRGFRVIEGGYTPRGISDHAHYWVQLDFLQEKTP
jgi:endonuclease/exonuclease/phosphatase family metal-dependent hydrolase